MGVVPHKAEADSPLARMDMRVASVDPATASAVRRPAAYSRRALWAFTLGMSIRTTSSGLVPAVTRTYICIITVKNMHSYCQVTCNYCQSMLGMSIRTTSSGLIPAVTTHLHTRNYCQNMHSYCQVTCSYCQSMLGMSISTTGSGLVQQSHTCLLSMMHSKRQTA